MKNIRLLIFLLLNINLLLSSDDLPNKPYYFSDNEFKKYCFDFGSNNTQYGMLLKSEIQLKGCELLEVRLINLQRMVQKQEIFLDYWGKVSQYLDQTESNGLKPLHNEEKQGLMNFLMLVDMYFNASEEIPRNTFRLKNKFNEFESILKSHVKSNEYDNISIAQFHSIVMVSKSEIDVDNEKSVDDFLNNTPEPSKQNIFALFKLYEETVKLNYSDIKHNYYNNCTRIC